MIRYMTAGESHGKGLAVIIDGVPANLKISQSCLDTYLSGRQKGYGRGGRQKIEKDRAEILSGIRFGKTTGAPLSIFIKNRDFINWQKAMSIEPVSGEKRALTVPRPGHADLSGGIKYNQKDMRNVLERASARETAARVAAGAVAKRMLEEFNINIAGYVINIGGEGGGSAAKAGPKEVLKRIKNTAKKHGVWLRTPDTRSAPLMKKTIDKAGGDGDTVGGIIEVVTSPLPPGLGDYTQWDKKLDAKIAAAVMSIQAVKGVEFGEGFDYARGAGSEFHDSIYYTKKRGFFRKTNSAGGFEGGMTNGQPVVLRAAVKPRSTVKKGLDSVNLKSKKRVKTVYERSDVCAVPAASLIAEAVAALEIASALCVKAGGDEISLMKENYKNYLKYIRKY